MDKVFSLFPKVFWESSNSNMVYYMWTVWKRRPTKI